MATALFATQRKKSAKTQAQQLPGQRFRVFVLVIFLFSLALSVSTYNIVKFQQAFYLAPLACVFSFCGLVSREKGVVCLFRYLKLF